MKKIYAGNLPWNTTEEELKELFGQYGEVLSAAVVTERDTGRSRGFGFVEMEDAEAERAIAELNEKEFGGRTLRINEAQSRQNRGRQQRW